MSSKLKTNTFEIKLQPFGPIQNIWTSEGQMAEPNLLQQYVSFLVITLQFDSTILRWDVKQSRNLKKLVHKFLVWKNVCNRLHKRSGSLRIADLCSNIVFLPAWHHSISDSRRLARAQKLHLEFNSTKVCDAICCKLPRATWNLHKATLTHAGLAHGRHKL